MTNRTLSLKREALAGLSEEELVEVNAAGLEVPRTLKVQECWGDLFTHHTSLDCLTRTACS